MGDSQPTVYLEDIDPTCKPKRERSDDDPQAESSSTITPSPAKRQRTLAEMFSGAQSKTCTKSTSLKGLTLSNVASDTSSATRPKVSGLVKLNSIPFSMTAYLESLSDEEKPLLELECEVMGKSWIKVLKDEIKKPYFLKLKQFLWNEGVRTSESNDTPAKVKIFPPPKNIYTWSNTPLGKIKVVILGQGLCFSVPVGVAIPPSLKNIYAEIKAEYPEFNIPNHGNLSNWAENGVLMLNTCLTVRQGNSNSHADKGWETFTDYVIQMVDKYGGSNLPSREASGGSGFGRGVVFLAWGTHASKRVAKLDKIKHLILKSAHPSPFSANKGFLGNGHFKLANQWLEQKYGMDGRIDWCAL
ncbi:uracil-DNA glycosylase [Phlegmacium glaucopus]|nr:uracil-DNA glycosylase [Phlegmacium glaucopus]